MSQQHPPSGGSRKISFNVSDQYDIQDVIGEGAYGVVWYVGNYAQRRWTYTNLLQLGTT